MRVRLLPLLAIALAPSVARGSAAEVFGLGAEEAGVGGASAARVRDFSAGHYNPAGLTRALRPEGSFGILGFGAGSFGACGFGPGSCCTPSKLANQECRG